jgi:DNA oxidative demethylase
MTRSSASRNVDLFDDAPGPRAQRLSLGPGATLLSEFASPSASALLGALQEITAVAPFRHMVTPGGFRMSVAMTNCGAAGWVSDETGYRYDAVDPVSGIPWPGMPACFLELASAAAARTGFAGFAPDACLINRYEPLGRLALHQDKNERDFSAPIVSVSLGVPATFLFGGLKRSERARRVSLLHGDVMVWGGPARLRYHGVLPLKEDFHPVLGRQRINLTLRRAL